jgi:hypothetical protein
MKALQLYYTSCKKGQSSGTGFQTYSMSEGITDEEKREIERFGLYVPPANLPTQPTPVEIDTIFPIALRFFRLESGRYGVCQAKYIGKDYSGRYGNYFCHALILEKGNFPFYPIQYYLHPVFKECLTDEESEINITPPPLQALDLDKITAAPGFSFDEIAAFTARTGIEPVKGMISAAISCDQTHRSLILCDLPGEIPYRIAAVQMAFPLEMAHNITFSTYHHDPEAQDIMITGVPREGSRFSFSDTQRDYENYIFDFETSNSSHIDETYEFTNNVDLGYTISRQSLEEFHRFISMFSFNRINSELDSISHLYRIAGVGIEDLTPEQILSAVEFANRYASPTVLQALSESLRQILENLGRQVNAQSAEIISKFLFKIARGSTDKKLLETAYHFFFGALNHLLEGNNGEDPDPGAIENFFTAIKNETYAHGEEFPCQTLSTIRFQKMIQVVSNPPAPLRSAILLRQVFDTLITFRYNWNKVMEKQPLFKTFVQTAVNWTIKSRENLGRALAAAAKDNHFFADFVSFILNNTAAGSGNHSVLMDSYLKIMGNKTTETAVGIRLNLIRYGHEPFIYDEYKRLLEDAPKKNEFFWIYFDSIFRKDREFSKEYFSAAAADFLDQITPKAEHAQCGKLAEHETYIFDRDVMKRVVERFEYGLPLSPPTNNEELKKVIRLWELKKNRKIETSPDIARLILLGVDFERAYAGMETVKISRLIKPGSKTYSLEKLNTQRVTEYFAWILPYLLRLVQTEKDHEIAFQWLEGSKLDKQFLVEYISVMKDVLKENKESGLNTLSSFLDFYLSVLSGDRRYDIVRERARAGLVKILCKLTPKQFSETRKKISAGSARSGTAPAKSELFTIMEAVDRKRNNTLLSRITRIFSKTEKDVNEKKAKAKK